MKIIVKLTAAAAVCTGLMLAAPLAEASETGLHIIHILRHEHGRTCMAGHMHYGSAKERATKALARAAAVEAWAELVAVEYGTDWARFRRASSKVEKCKVSSRVWSCDVEGRPCK